MIQPSEFAAGCQKGCIRTLSKAISLMENQRPDILLKKQNLFQYCAKLLTEQDKRSIRLGISGVGGVGKSSFIEKLGLHILESNQKQKLAVLAIDPSSAISGGSILGDKTRMNQLACHPRAFIRPSPSGQAFGGAGRYSHEIIQILEAWGFDTIIVETVGAGQMDSFVRQVTDIFTLMYMPATGDSLQGIKRGSLEFADLVAVHKADGHLEPAAQLAANQLRGAMQITHQAKKRTFDPVALTSVQKPHLIKKFADKIQNMHSEMLESQSLDKIRRHQVTNWVQWEVLERLKQMAEDQNSELGAMILNFSQNRTIYPPSRAEEIIAQFHRK